MIDKVEELRQLLFAYKFQEVRENVINLLEEIINEANFTLDKDKQYFEDNIGLIEYFYSNNYLLGVLDVLKFDVLPMIEKE